MIGLPGYFAHEIATVGARRHRLRLTSRAVVMGEERQPGAAAEPGDSVGVDHHRAAEDGARARRARARWDGAPSARRRRCWRGPSAWGPTGRCTGGAGSTRASGRRRATSPFGSFIHPSGGARCQTRRCGARRVDRGHRSDGGAGRWRVGLVDEPDHAVGGDGERVAVAAEHVVAHDGDRPLAAPPTRALRPARRPRARRSWPDRRSDRRAGG